MNEQERQKILKTVKVYQKTKQERMREAWRILHADMKKQRQVVESTPEYDREFDRIQQMDKLKRK